MSSNHPVFRSTGTTNGRRAPPAWLMAPVLDLPPAPAASASAPIAPVVQPTAIAPVNIIAPPQRAGPVRRNSEWQAAEDEATDVIRPWTMRAWE